MDGDCDERRISSDRDLRRRHPDLLTADRAATETTLIVIVV
jgi:hypothetical protein